jgi:hypothetical protein
MGPSAETGDSSGRGDMIHRLEARLLHAGVHAEAALAGLGGIGRSRLRSSVPSWRGSGGRTAQVFGCQHSAATTVRKAHCNFGLPLRVVGTVYIVATEEHVQLRHL